MSGRVECVGSGARRVVEPRRLVKLVEAAETVELLDERGTSYCLSSHRRGGAMALQFVAPRADRRDGLLVGEDLERVLRRLEHASTRRGEFWRDRGGRLREAEDRGVQTLLEEPEGDFSVDPADDPVAVNAKQLRAARVSGYLASEFDW
jgi:hypothetical protein